jgi:hypothetical protein
MHSESGWLLRELPPPVDVTTRFLELYSARARADARALLVGGIFTDSYPAYLRAIRRALDAREIDIGTARGTLADNAARIADAVRREREPVVLLGQSKGPIDIHAALVLHPDIVPGVRAFVSVQAPFGGTPLARRKPDAFWDISYERRQAFLRAHPAMPPVPTVALATHTARAGLFLEKTRKFIAVPNDGFVAVADAHIPGARLVLLEGIDHASLALRWLRPFGRYEPGRVARALIALALE